MKNCFVLPIALTAAACSAPQHSLDMPCARAEWDPPERVEGGGELPFVRVEDVGSCGEVTFEVRAFRDANADGRADAGAAASVTTGRVGPADRAAEVQHVRLLGDASLRWVLWIRTAQGEALVDLGWIR